MTLIDDAGEVLNGFIKACAFDRPAGRVRARFALTLDNHQDEVWRALTRPDWLVEWLAPGGIDLRPGGAVDLAFRDSGVVIASTVMAFEPQRLLEYSWSGPGEPQRPVRFELTPEGPATHLAVSLSVPEVEDAARAAAGWAAHLDMLAAVLAGAPIRFPLPVFRAARELYQRRLAS